MPVQQMQIDEAIEKLLQRVEDTRADLLQEFGSNKINHLADYECEELYMSIAALGLKIPKEATVVNDGNLWDIAHFHCPTCGEIVYLTNFCANCGQALKMEVNDDVFEY